MLIGFVFTQCCKDVLVSLSNKKNFFKAQLLCWLKLFMAKTGRQNTVVYCLSWRIFRFISDMEKLFQIINMEHALQAKHASCHHRAERTELSKILESHIRCVKCTSIDWTCVISSPKAMFDILLESSRWDDSNKWSNLGFNKEIYFVEIKKCTLSEVLAI